MPESINGERNKESFVLYESAFKQMEILEKRLGKETAYNFIKAIAEFGLYGVVPEEENEVWLYGFEQTITSIHKAKDRYTAAIENGKKGGRKATIDRNKVIELKEQGLTNKQIADNLNCSVSSIEKIVAKTGKTGKTHNNLNDNVNDNVNENEKENVIAVFPTENPLPAAAAAGATAKYIDIDF